MVKIGNGENPDPGKASLIPDPISGIRNTGSNQLFIFCVIQALKDLPDEIPLQLTLGTKVTAR